MGAGCVGTVVGQDTLKEMLGAVADRADPSKMDAAEAKLRRDLAMAEARCYWHSRMQGLDAKKHRERHAAVLAELAKHMDKYGVPWFKCSFKGRGFAAEFDCKTCAYRHRMEFRNYYFRSRRHPETKEPNGIIGIRNWMLANREDYGKEFKAHKERFGAVMKELVEHSCSLDYGTGILRVVPCVVKFGETHVDSECATCKSRVMRRRFAMMFGAPKRGYSMNSYMSGLASLMKDRYNQKISPGRPTTFLDRHKARMKETLSFIKDRPLGPKVPEENIGQLCKQAMHDVTEQHQWKAALDRLSLEEHQAKMRPVLKIIKRHCNDCFQTSWGWNRCDEKTCRFCARWNAVIAGTSRRLWSGQRENIARGLADYFTGRRHGAAFALQHINKGHGDASAVFAQQFIRTWDRFVKQAPADLRWEEKKREWAQTLRTVKTDPDLPPDWIWIGDKLVVMHKDAALRMLEDKQ